ncbi:hypothetical protein CBS101457_002384 [Exobasidium rhododendri]|nr:hypothetical protein CBS101457_002384 [Exobasidium rhododendri]
MNRNHPYGGYDQGPPDRGNRPAIEGNHPYGNDGSAGGYYPSLAPQQQQNQQQQQHQHQQQQHQQHQSHPLQQPQQYPPPPSMSNQIDYPGGPNREYREGVGAYPPLPHDYRTGMTPLNGGDGRLGPTSGITLGSGPLNNQSQYGGPVRYEGGQGGTQSPASSVHSHNPYGAGPDSHHYTAENASNPSRALPPQMRPQSHYDTHLPPKPDAGE